MSEIINRVAQSGIISLDLEDYYPEGERVLYDLKDNLFEGLILKEQDFRNFLKTNEWSRYKDKYVAITCSADAIIPTWAYMLLTSRITPYAKKVVAGNLERLEEVLMEEAIKN